MLDVVVGKDDAQPPGRCGVAVHDLRHRVDQLMIRFAIMQPGTALPPNTTVRGSASQRGSRFSDDRA